MIFSDVDDQSIIVMTSGTSADSLRIDEIGEKEKIEVKNGRQTPPSFAEDSEIENNGLRFAFSA